MRINCFPSERLTLILLIVMIAVVVWTSLHRHEGYSVVFKSYQQLYAPAESPRIVGFEFDNRDEIAIDLENLSDDKWTISLLSGDRIVRKQTSVSKPKFTLEPGIHRYVVTGNRSLDEFQVQVSWGPGISRPIISRSSLPISTATPYAISDFVSPTEDYLSEEVTTAKSLLSAGSFDKDISTLARAQLLAALLHDSLEPFRGNPEPGMRGMTGFQQYEEAMAGRSAVYCANHSDIFAFFANAIGIPTRVVDITGRLEDVDLGAHTFIEAYIHDLRQWIYIDLQLNIAGITGGTGRYLNSAELLHRIVSKSTDDLIVHNLKDNELFPVPYSDTADVLETFFNPEATLVYLLASANRFATATRIGRFFVNPNPAYSLGENGNGAVWRISLTYLALGCLVLWFFMRTRHGLRRCGCYAY